MRWRASRTLRRSPLRTSHELEVVKAPPNQTAVRMTFLQKKTHPLRSGYQESRGHATKEMHRVLA
jgi:hypothetical protein